MRGLIGKWKGSWLQAGMVGASGGLMGASVMAGLQILLRRYLQTRCTPGELADSGIGFQAVFRRPEPAGLTAQTLTSRADTQVKYTLAPALVIHGCFGAFAGTFYSGVVRRILPARMPVALGFGAALWLGATEVVLPLLSLSKRPSRSSPEIQIFGLAEHLLYAFTVEQVCRRVLLAKS